MQEVLVPAVVAVITTLLVEYLAKPGLEARKDRIVERGRQRRDAGRALDQILYEAGRLSTYRDNVISDDPLGRRAIEIARGLGPRLPQLVRDLDVPEAFEDRFFEDAAIIQTVAAMVVDSATPPSPGMWDDLDRAGDWLDDLGDYIQTPQYRWLRRRRLRNRLKASGKHGGTS